MSVPIVKLQSGKPVTTSKDVAAYFGKRHDHVIRDIEALISQEPAIAPNFGAIETDVKVGFGTRKSPAYQMDRDGFTLLAMGFTGPKALKFKMALTRAGAGSTWTPIRSFPKKVWRFALRHPPRSGPISGSQKPVKSHGV